MAEARRESTRIIPDGTVSLLAQLCIDPNADVRCSLSAGDPAVAIYVTPNGCAARPNDRIQALCLQHIETDGISTGSRPVLDLTVNEAWSRRAELDMPLHLGYDPTQLQTFLAQLATEGVQVETT